MNNITAFTIGVAAAFFAIFSINILFWRKNQSRFQTVLGCIMAVWCLWMLKDMVLTYPGMYREEVLDWILIIDGWSALTYMVLICEVVMPGWLTWGKLMLSAIPFAAFTMAYSLWQHPMVIYAYVGFLWCFSWTIVIVGYVKMKKTLAYLYDNYSNTDRIDVSWLRSVFFFCIVGQLLWLAVSFWASPVADTAYYVVAMALWLLVLYKCWDFRPVRIAADPLGQEVAKNKKATALPEGVLEQVVEENRLYLNQMLTVADLAKALGTNRTYVSSYLSQQLGLTFYDYINKLRIERVSIPLIKEHPEFTFEYVAKESGFASISTFRRAFLKITGLTPSQFAATMETN